MVIQDESSTSNRNARLVVLSAVIVWGALMRLMPHPPNCTPIGAIALFAGARVDSRRLALAVPLLSMYLSDVILGALVYDFGLYHSGMPWVYASFIATVGLGRLICRTKGAKRVATAAVISSAIFFVVTNFGFWVGGQWYPSSWQGLATCYLAALPFSRNMLLGDLFWGGVLFGGWALVEWRFPVLRLPARETLVTP